MHPSTPTTRRLAAVLALCAGAISVAEAQVVPVRISIKRVSGTPPGTTGPLAPDSAWAGPAGDALIQQMVTGASTILSAPGAALTGCASAVPSPTGTPLRISLVYTPSTDLVDLVDPAYPFSFQDVWLGPSATWKDAMEAACEADPARYAYRPDAINVYLVDTIDGPSGFGGYCSFPIGVFSTFPDETDVIFMAGQTIANPSLAAAYYATTLAHEIGHYFGLTHTFESSFYAGGGGFEAAPSPCGACSSLILADQVDDTPADPWIPGVAATQTIANLAAVYGACPSNQNQLRGNVMAQYYLVDPAFSVPGMSLSVGQRRRMSNFLGARSRVLASSVVPSIAAVLPSSFDHSTQNTSLLVSGCDLPSSASGQVDVTLGLIDCSAPGPTCAPEFSGSNTTSLVDVTSATPCANVTPDLFVTYAGPIPPGRHTVCVRQNGETVASLNDAVAVTPYLDLALTNAVTETFTLTVQTAAPNQPYMLALQTGSTTGYTVAAPPPFPLPSATVPGFSYRLFIDFSSPTTLLGDPATGLLLSTGATGSASIPFSTAGYLSGARFFCQGVELTANGPGGTFQFTNLVELAIP